MANQSEVRTIGVDQFIKALEDMPKVITKQLLPYVVELTPIDKDPKAKNPGHARSNTSIVNDTTIHANYDYAERLLHEGWSDQLPANVFDQKINEKVSHLVNDYIRKI